MLTYKLPVGEVPQTKHKTEMIGLSDIKNNVLETSPKMNPHLNQSSYLYKVLYPASPSWLSVQDLTAHYQVNVVDKATGKVVAKVLLLKDSVEIGQVTLTSNGEYKLQIFCLLLIKDVLKIQSIDHIGFKVDYDKPGDDHNFIASCNMINDIKIGVKMTPTVLSSELLVGQVSHMKLTTEMLVSSNVMTGGKVECQLFLAKDLVEIVKLTLSSFEEEKYEIKLN